MAKKKSRKKGKKNWIAGAIGKPGALRKALKVKAGAKKGGKLGRQARLAVTLGKMRKTRRKR